MTDQRTDPRIAGVQDIRPVVGEPRRDLPPWLLGAVVVTGALALFAVLEARRHERSAPATQPTAADVVGTSWAPPPLELPADSAAIPVQGLTPAAPPLPPPIQPPLPPAPGVAPAPAMSPPAPQGPAAPAYLPLRGYSGDALQPGYPSSSGSAGGAVVYDRTAQSSSAPVSAATGAEGSGGRSQGAASDPSRVRITRLGQLAATVPQGALVPAVLETALDSTRPGLVRALVTRDVKGFDGTRVLIPRGARLFGEYQSDVLPGQRRALVRWTRLVLPNGVAVEMDSPVADSLGRAGVEGRVNSHFLERFANALMQSAVNIGVAVAGRELADSPVIVALPGSAQTVAGSGEGQQIAPTLQVPAGATVTVFVAQDITFP